MTYRVWWADEFVELKTEEERDAEAWPVPTTRGIFDRERIIECEDIDEAAERYAEYFLHQRDGYENTWPLTFIVHDGRDYHRVSVELEHEPVFRCSKPEVFTP